MAKSANHAIVMAQLIIDGKNYGVQGFLLQLREFVTHKVRLGIEIGDIGPKFGINMVDNGFLKLTNVRIPRENMLMRYARVDSDGVFSKPPHSKLAYGTMVLVRASIVDSCSKFIGRAVTIAVRYSAVRRQFASSSTGKETQILDYQTQQHKLFPLIAAAYGMYFVGKDMMRLYHLNNEKLSKEDVSLLPEIHALTSGWKAITTEIANQGIEIARKSLGGHGYSMFSGGKTLIIIFIFTYIFQSSIFIRTLFLLKHTREKILFSTYKRQGFC